MQLLRRQKSINFTEGAVIGKLLLFAVPILLSELLQNLYNTVDSYVVGNYVSETALAAVSVCAPISNLLIGFFNGVSIGNTVVVAKAFGRGDENETRNAICYAFTFSVVMGVIVSALGILLAPALLHITGCNEEIYEQAIVYLRIYLAGLMFTVIYNCGTGILRAIGDSASPLYVLMLTTVLNIGLDLLFVIAFGWGIAGVGIATIVAQGLSMLLVYVLIRRRTGKNPLDFVRTLRDGRKVILGSVRVGFAAGLQNALISFSNLFVWSYISGFPTAVTAGVGVGMKVDRFVVMPCTSLAMTTTTFVSQNLGARNFSRAKKGFWYGFGLSAAVTMPLALLLYLFAEPVINLFSSDPAVIRAGAAMSRFLAPIYIIMVLREVLLGYLRGYGISRIPMILSLVGMVAVRHFYLALVMPRVGTVQVFYTSFPVGWGATLILLLVFTMIVRKRM